MKPKDLYTYLHSMIDEATCHFDECDADLLDCDCGAQTNGGDLVDIFMAELARLRNMDALADAQNLTIEEIVPPLRG